MKLEFIGIAETSKIVFRMDGQLCLATLSVDKSNINYNCVVANIRSQNYVYVISNAVTRESLEETMDIIEYLAEHIKKN